MWTPLQRGVQALIVLSICLVVPALGSQQDNQDRELAYNQPKWIAQIKSRAETGFRLCSRRNDVAPYEGEACSFVPKVCYFDTQSCGVPHPSTRCECSGGNAATRTPGKWSCDIENCPNCPVTQPEPGEACTAEGMTCKYGESRCCGTRSPEMSCKCQDGQYLCFFTDSCMLPPCMFEHWSDLVGKSCTDATAFVKQKYPGLDVQCVPVKPVIEEANFDLNRIYVIVNATQIVTEAPTVG